MSASRTPGDPAAAPVHIVWDWNGTLLHDIDAVIAATNASFAEFGFAPITLERYRELYVVPVPKFYERLMGRLPTDAEWEVMDATFHRYYWAAADAAGLTEGLASSCATGRPRGSRSPCSPSRPTRSSYRSCRRTASSGTSCASTAGPAPRTPARQDISYAIWRPWRRRA